MREPVQQCSDHLRIPEHTGPLAEAQVGGDLITTTADRAIAVAAAGPTQGPLRPSCRHESG